MYIPGTQANRQAGQAAVLSVVFIVAILFFAAVVIDGGNFLLTKRNLQGTADASALAAARELPDSTELATLQARDYVEVKNDHEDAVIEDITYAGNNQRILLELERETPGAFMNFFGISAPTIRARAMAERGQVIAMEGVLPFAALEGAIVDDTPFAVKIGPGSSHEGNFGAVAPTESPDCVDELLGSNDYGHAIEGEFAVGGVATCGPSSTCRCEPLNTQTGNLVGKTRDGFRNRFGSADGTHPDLFADTVHWDADDGQWVIDKPNSPRIGFIPIIVDSADFPAWPSGSSRDMIVVDYVLVYIGKVGDPAWPGENAYTPLMGNPVEVWIKPLSPGQMPDGTNVETGGTWDPDSLAPTVVHLLDADDGL